MPVHSAGGPPPPTLFRRLDSRLVTEPLAHLRTLDLFAGAGGLTQGFREASDRFVPVRAVELDRAAAATYALNHDPDHVVDGGELKSHMVYAGGIEQWLDEERVPEVDVVIGGPPCQGFSQLGKQDEDDPRNLLWRHYVHTVTLAKPRYFVIENVPGFKKSRQWSIFLDALHGDLSDYGLARVDGAPDGEYAAVLNASHFGAAQARKRAVVIGYRKDQPDPRYPRPGLLEDPPTLADALCDVPEAIDKDAQLLPSGRSVLYEGKSFPGPFDTPELHLTREYSELSIARFSHIGPGQNRNALPWELRARCWQDHTSGSGDVMGRLEWHKPSVTIRTEFFKPEKGRYIHPTQPRAISHWEAARIQGFPDTYRWVGSKVQVARQIGNAVPVPLGKAIAQHLLEAMA